MAADIPEYRYWEALRSDNWEHWENERNRYDYALQKTANTVLSSRFYPAFSQDRLLRLQFVENMQQLGDVDLSEIDEYKAQTKISILYPFKYWNGGVRDGMHLEIFEVALIYCLGIGAWAIGKPVSWMAISPMFGSLLYFSINNKRNKSRIGEVVDFTNWVMEKRKAKIWIEEKKTLVAKMPLFPDLQKQLLSLIKGFKA